MRHIRNNEARRIWRASWGCSAGKPEAGKIVIHIFAPGCAAEVCVRKVSAAVGWFTLKKLPRCTPRR